MNCDFVQTTVHAYFDGELDALRSADFEDHLELCSDCKDELKKIGALRRRLQESELFERASSQLRDRIRKQITKDGDGRHSALFSGRRVILIPAFGALVAAAACLVLVFSIFQSHSRSTRITAELIDAHVRSLQPGHLTDVLSTDQHTVKPWFEGKLDFIPPVADYSAQGFPLIGGRLDVVDGHNVAALVYARRKHFINLFVWPYHEKEWSFVSSGSRQGYNWMTWQSGDMQFCLISDAADTDLYDLKGLMYR